MPRTWGFTLELSILYLECPFWRITLPIFPGLGPAQDWAGLLSLWLGYIYYLLIPNLHIQIPQHYCMTPNPFIFLTRLPTRPIPNHPISINLPLKKNTTPPPVLPLATPETLPTLPKAHSHLHPTFASLVHWSLCQSHFSYTQHRVL